MSVAAWRCRECAAPWPCQPARLRLRREYAHDRPGLAVYLCMLMHDAIADAPRRGPGEVDPAEHFARFVGWTRPWPVQGTTASCPDCRSDRAP
ncbi:hypothetical protein [Micromonospora sp. AKA38]|uniref:hypothetical protein n=1 Tax=Micromonospora sp. AKA38 TaxID=2733861 RepID=UPI0022CA4A5B|nr:hypothetical protein [Micromonospora sp. AKA38]GHJ13343.1 hypothetical protein TPA0908_13380 [Micromonospora sp. AKA38]